MEKRTRSSHGERGVVGFLPSLLVLWALGHVACVGHYGSPGGAAHKVLNEPVYFVAGAPDYRSTSSEKVLNPADATLMASGLQGFGFTPEDVNTRITWADMVKYLESDLEIFYVTGHGGDAGITLVDVTLTPEGFVAGDGTFHSQEVAIWPRYLILANCRSGGNDWSKAFTERTEGVFGYTVDTKDGQDNAVVREYLECLDEDWEQGQLWSAEEQSACWQRANEVKGGPFASGWVAYVRRNQDEIWRLDPSGEERLVP